jgi:IS30 family transposase
MGARRRRRSDRAGRPAMRSPGRPPAGRKEHRQRFWAAIARGLTSEDAAAEADVSAAVGVRWFREGGGMPSVALGPPSGRYLSFAEREEIALLRVRGCGVREIARALGRSPSTISRELRRNAATRGGGLEYRASTAQWHADRRSRRPKPAKLAVNPELRRYVQDRLSGAVKRPDGVAVDGPAVAWIGRRHGRRKDRRWARSWSPEQISNRLRLDFPDYESMRVSHEAIYQSLYIQGRGALRRELTACLRTGRALRVPRARTWRGKSFVTDEILISERPAEAVDRGVPGHWEGDLILGLGSSAIGTLVERSSRFTMLLHLPPMDGRGVPRIKNGPALTGHGAEAVRDAIAAAITTLPEQLRRSLTWDQGAEMAQHAQLRIDTGLEVYFCDPQSPWQRGTNENTNGLLRQYLPKGTDLGRHSADDLAAVAAALNSRPRKTLGWRTPAEVLDEYLPTTAGAGRAGGLSGAHAAIAAAARPPGAPPRRQPRHPAGGAAVGTPTQPSPAVPRFVSRTHCCDDRLSPPST